MPECSRRDWRIRHKCRDSRTGLARAGNVRLRAIMHVLDRADLAERCICTSSTSGGCLMMVPSTSLFTSSLFCLKHWISSHDREPQEGDQRARLESEALRTTVHVLSRARPQLRRIAPTLVVAFDPVS